MIKFFPYILFEKYINILALEMASPGNRHCANCIGTLSLPLYTAADSPLPDDLTGSHDGLHGVLATWRACRRVLPRQASSAPSCYVVYWRPHSPAPFCIIIIIIIIIILNLGRSSRGGRQKLILEIIALMVNHPSGSLIIIIIFLYPR